MKKIQWLGVVLGTFAGQFTFAQTFTDGLMMRHRVLCNAVGYSHDRWTNYWEGSLNRENGNIGNITTQAVTPMFAYGLTPRLNVLATLPYVWTASSQGTLRGERGFQDLTVGVKYRPITLGKATGTHLDVMLVGAVSTPVSNYSPDFFPLSLGFGARTAQARVALQGHLASGWFVNGQVGYLVRSQVTLDRNSYYTDRLYLTNRVNLSNVAHFTGRAGYNKNGLILEATFEQMTTLGGTDIRRQDAPFVSNRMLATRVGAMATYRPKSWRGLGISAMASQTVAGRNVGQSLTLGGTVQYIIHFKGNQTDSSTN